MDHVFYKEKKFEIRYNKLDLSKLGIKDISEIQGLESLANLQVLSLYGNQIREIQGLESLANLKRLSLDGNQINEIQGLESLANLSWLSLDGNQINEIQGLESLANLERLDLDGNQINEIQGLESLANLQVLYLFGNQIQEIKGLDFLTNLQVLYLNENQIQEIKGLDFLTNLQVLYLNENQIQEIKGLEAFANLQELYLYGNKIQEIKGLESLANLQRLDLGRNKIYEIKGLESLANLQVLYLNENQIQEIKGLEALANLQVLYLNENQIQEIKGLEALSKLRRISLEGNLLRGFDDFYANSGFSAQKIVEYSKKKTQVKEVQFLDDYYDRNKSPEDNLEDYKEILSEEETLNFINIGTNLEDKKVAFKQNVVFYHQKAEEIQLNEKDITLSNLNINLIQVNSLKGVEPKNKDKFGHFLFFVKQFWDDNELDNNVLIYNHNSPSINSKIDELLSLSLLNNPNLIVFPENSVPFSKIDTLIKISKNHQVTIVCGLEHEKINSEYVNKALIIDNGKVGEQIKQTPVEIKQRDGNHLRENIRCQTFPHIKIFITSIGRIAIFICKDFLRLCDKIPEWAGENKVDFVIIPSLTSKILPFHTKALNLLNYSGYKELRLIFASVGEYGGSEIFSIDHVKRIEESFRKNVRDNVGEVIVSREISVIREEDKPHRKIFEYYL